MSPPWSATRARTFQECRRKYYYRYHLAPLGRKPDAPREAQQAHRVKDLIGVEAWAGELVHTLIQRILTAWRCGRHVTEEDVAEQAKRLLSRQFRDSHDYWTAHADEFPHRPALLDLHYYGDRSLTRERAASLRETVVTSVREFLRSELAQRIRAVGPSRWLPIDRNAAARLDDGVLILVKPDFAFRDGDYLHVVDWKTGRPDPFWELVQVTCYALYAEQQWSHPLPGVVPRIVHLFPEFRITDAEYGPRSLREVQQFIQDSQGQITSLLTPDALPPIERFPCTDSGACRWCPFRGQCEGAARRE